MLSLSAPGTKLHLSLPILFRDSGNVNVHPSVANFGVLSGTGTSTRFVTLRLDPGVGSVDDVRLESDSDALQPDIVPVGRTAARISLMFEPSRLRLKQGQPATAVAGAVRVRLRGAVMARVPWVALLR